MSSTSINITLRQPRVVMIGDSLSVGCNDPSLAWKLQPGSLREQLSETSALFLGAANGCNTNMMIQGLPTVLDKCKAEEFDPDTFIIWAGANDSVVSPPPTCRSQHVPLDTFKSNLASMVDSVRTAYPDADVILVNAPPVIPSVWHDIIAAKAKKHGDPPPEIDRTLQHSEQYAKATLDVAADFQSKQSEFKGKGAVHKVDAWGLVSEMAGGTEAEMLSKYYVDGLHLNEDGYRPVTKAVQKIVDSLFQSKDPSEKAPDKWSERSSPTVDLPNWRVLAADKPPYFGSENANQTE